MVNEDLSGLSGGISPAEAKRMEEIKKLILMNLLTREARERLNRLRLVKPDIAMQIELYLIQLYQSGKLQGRMSDEQLRSILEMLGSGKRFNIIKK